ncbi:hypothetical protein H7J71_02220 [Mycolicibacterium peregrinum]|uniref:hypothetical protein n=1 Tax=Mycolicibacterium peregrinum TaxID=43304 RepID=UPI000B28B4E8|nr:hypothetical protein [Mycolicibacterium peregrinum]MCV7200827.1 hypothetical protein [Mycolicibacterium peregrinum]
MAQNGIDALNNRRARRTRQAPPPRHPAAPAALSVVSDNIDDTADPLEPKPDQSAAVEEKPAQPAPPATEPQEHAAGAQVAAGGVAPTATAPAAPVVVQAPTKQPAGLPDLAIDLNDPDAHIPSPTVMSIPESIVVRFNSARATAPSHTAIVLNALREHAHELPALILARRPGPTPGDLFPWRGAPGKSGTETPLPLRIRPTKAERKVMKALETWASQQIRVQRPGAPETNRSEMVAAALDAYLPQQPHAAKKASRRSPS